jgi:hypothetical protein
LALEIAEHFPARAADGERDLEKLKSSAFKKLICKQTARFRLTALQTAMCHHAEYEKC